MDRLREELRSKEDALHVEKERVKTGLSIKAEAERRLAIRNEEMVSPTRLEPLRQAHP